MTPNIEGFFCVTCGKDVPHDHTHVQTDGLLPPFHKPMTVELACHLANDRIAVLEMELQTAKNAYDQLHEIHHNTNVEWTKDIVRAREAVGALAKLRQTFSDHAAAAAGDRKHTWIAALKYLNEAWPLAEPDCDNCPQPHDEYNDPDCDACYAAFSERKP